MFSEALVLQAQQLLDMLARRGLLLATAESCTGGLIAALFTEIPGSSRVFERGFVTYSNEAKIQMLGVPADLIARHGAVSAQVAEAMAEGALKNCRARLALSVTGIAGPGGGSPDKPVGLVYIACATGYLVKTQRCHFTGNRSAVRQASLIEALEMLKSSAGNLL